MIKLLLVDDQAVMREAVSVWLGIEPDVTVVGQADSGEAALQLAPALQPDIILMDIDMPELDGIATTERMRAIAPESAVVILSMHDDEHVRARAEAAGARGFVSKYQALDQLLDVIRSVATRPTAA
ncbi:MAG TPA: response regulator transcription factor [Anaerolineales bacterium]|nr:response regulator transcription factor [Anaerolineales bacterium]HRF50470.1 response regulator transcription factor [Anaerolineales bacterium]